MLQLVLIFALSTQTALANNSYKRISLISDQKIINFKDDRKLFLQGFNDLDLCQRTAQELAENQINSIPPENRNTDNILRIKTNVKRYIKKGFPNQKIDDCNIGALITISELESERAYIVHIALTKKET